MAGQRFVVARAHLGLMAALYPGFAPPSQRASCQRCAHPHRRRGGGHGAPLSRASRRGRGAAWSRAARASGPGERIGDEGKAASLGVP
jgi:hypothetical protein